MAYSDILFEVRNQIAWLTINRPDQGNTFRRQTVLEMIQALNEARNDAGVRVVVITGAGDRFFCIGGEKEPNDGLLHYHNVPPVVDLYTLIDMMPVPVIAMVNGFSVGGGNVLANMCDLTVASEQAMFRQVGPAMGSYDAGFGTWYLEDSVGRKRAREIWYLNRKYSAKEAQAMGLVNEVAPHALLRERTEAMCEELKKRGPQALNEARNDAGVRVVVITGAGDRFFCIGGEKEPNDGLLHYHNVPPVVDLYTLIDMMPVPVIAMVNGFSVGGGNVLANMCDLTVASEQATFRQVGPSMGSYDAGFGTWYLEDSVGRKRAKEIWYLNRKYSAKEAQAMGLVNDVAPHAELRARTEAMCEELKKRGPQALGALKAAFHARHNGVTGLSRMSIDHLVANYYHTEEAKEMGRAFNSKQDPNPDKFYK